MLWCAAPVSMFVVVVMATEAIRQQMMSHRCLSAGNRTVSARSVRNLKQALFEGKQSFAGISLIKSHGR